MNKNKYINLFVGLLIGVSGAYAVLNWIDIHSVVMGSISILGLVFAIWYNKEVLD